MLKLEATTGGVALKKDVLKNFDNFTGKHLYQGLVFSKGEENLIEKETLVELFSCEFLRTLFYRTQQRLLLFVQYLQFKNLDKTILFSKNQVFCLKNWKLWRAPTTVEFNTFCWNFAQFSYSPISKIGCSGFFLFCLDLELFAKIKMTWFLYTHKDLFYQ